MRRRHFIASSAAAMSAAALPRLASAQLPIASKRAARKALVLSGGGNRGAYEAGIIQAIVDKNGLRDGQPLEYDLVLGTSIGALNSYLIATAQYSKLQRAWQLIPSLNVTRLKSPYYKITEQSSGVLSRLWAALDLGLSLTKHEKGVLDPAGVNDVLNKAVDPGDPVYLPLYVATTNLTRMRGEVFVRRATTPDGLKKQALNDEILANYTLSILRPAGDDVVRNMLFASAAIPVAFEPVLLPSLDHPGTNDSYVDGGVTENVPLDVARRCAETLNVILVDPPNPDPHLPANNAAQVAAGVFVTMQRRILQYQIELAFAESFAIANAGRSEVTKDIALEVYYIQPDIEMPGNFADFSDEKAIHRMYEIGYDDGSARGWKKFEFKNLRD
jgi:predicted acylesterase/phospholipase RssA